MSSDHPILTKLNELLAQCYYTEDFELIATFRVFVDALDEQEMNLVTGEVLRRLKENPTLFELQLCTCLDVVHELPYFTELLNREQDAGQVSRILILLLSQYPDENAYVAISRFLDSGQHPEALTALSNMNFAQSAPAIRKALAEEGLYTTCIHILYRRYREVGSERFLEDLILIGHGPLDRKRVEALFSRTAPEHNPFDQDMTDTILDWARTTRE